MNTINRKWYPKEIFEIAFSCKDRSEFRKNHNQVYKAAIRLNLLNKIYQKLPKKDLKWNINKIRLIAKKYKTKKDFRENAYNAYIAARKLNCLQDVSSHMKPSGNRFDRMLYAFEFPDNSVYIGLTYNYESRYANHMKKSKNIIKKTHALGHTFIMFNELYSWDIVGKKESLLIEKYRNKGWKILNKAKGGSLGGTTTKWTTKNLLTIIAKYQTKNEFYKKNRSAYNSAYRSKNSLVKKEFNKLSNKYKTWSKKLLLEEIKKYNYISDFRKKSPNAYRAIKKLKLNHLLKEHLTKKDKWTKEYIFELTHSFKEYKKFIKHNRTAYKKAIELNILEEIQLSFNYKGNIKWTKEKILHESTKYKTLKDFREKSPKAHNAARKSKIMNEISKNLVKKGQKKWTKEKILEVAKKCKTYTYLMKTYPRAYEVARIEYKLLPKIKEIYNI